MFPVCPWFEAVVGPTAQYVRSDCVPRCGRSGEDVRIVSLDAAVMSPGDVYHLLEYEGNTQPDMTGGVHWNLHNNLWGTAFPQCTCP